MKKPINTIHAGQLLKQVMYERQFSAMDMAKAIGFTREAIYRIQRRARIHPDLMQQFSEILGFNFLKIYYPPEMSQQDEQKMKQLETQVAELQKQLAELTKENGIMQEKITYLEEINRLLKSKKGS